MYSVLVFTRTKYLADRVAKQLGRSGISTGALHSNRTQNQRARALQEFKDGKIRVLVATDIAARGIGVDGITRVINYDFPPHTEDYVHRIGRTGRANMDGVAISFLTAADRDALRALERFIRRSIQIRKPIGFVCSPDTDPPPSRGRNRPSRGPRKGKGKPRKGGGNHSKGGGGGKRSGGDGQPRGEVRSGGGRPFGSSSGGSPGRRTNRTRRSFR